MATTFEIILPFGTPSSQECAEAGLDLIDALEAQLTVYRDDSEVSRLNQNAGRQPVPVERELFQLLAQCQRLAEGTGGAFDITVGASHQGVGFLSPRRPRAFSRGIARRACQNWHALSAA